MREAILNAVSHRMYQMSGSIFIRQSPRNRRIAEILSLCGLVERSGQGMNLIMKSASWKRKELPDFTDTDNNFVSLTLNGLIIDKKMQQVLPSLSRGEVQVLMRELKEQGKIYVEGKGQVQGGLQNNWDCN